MRNWQRFLLAGVIAMGASVASAQAQTNPPPAPTEVAPAPASEFAVAVETMVLTGAKAGFMETGSAAAGRQILVRSGGASSQVFGKTKTRRTDHFRFMKSEGEVTLAGKCTIRTEGRSMFGIDFAKNKAQAYSCTFADQPEAQYEMEVALPAFPETNIGGGLFSVTITNNEPDSVNQAILKAKLLFAGAAYEAMPTAFGPDTLGTRRVVKGYTISRDGKAVGRVVFRTKGFVMKEQADITIPVSDADGREAVLFMIMALNTMPDTFASQVREEMRR